jgi:hypothetical protein
MSSTVRHAAVIAAICAICALPLPALALDSGADAPNAGGASWSFRVLLDGKPIGQHQFRATDGAGERTLVSEAAFSVRLLGVSLDQYQHRAVERWLGDCLLALSADTDDTGERTRVSARALGEQFEVTAPIPQTERGCVMSFAYWNPALRAQQRLLNSQTGRIESVRVNAIGEGTLTVGKRMVSVSGWRISGAAQPIDVWYSSQGDWLGLDTLVDGGRTLSYRRL